MVALANTEAAIERLGELLEESRYAVALTGAGASTESDIPDFRSDAGFWSKADPMDVASIDGFEEDPRRFYAFWRDKFAMLAKAHPNAAHRLLAGLESRARMMTVITQNIDGLHQKAGSKNVLEVHGTFQRLTCMKCGKHEGIESLFSRYHHTDAEVPACLGCGSPRLKPDVVLFGEDLPPCFKDAEREIQAADLVVVMGTSLQVQPVSGLVPRAKQYGAKVVIMNRDPTHYDGLADLVIHGELGKVSARLMELLHL